MATGKTFAIPLQDVKTGDVFVLFPNSPARADRPDFCECWTPHGNIAADYPSHYRAVKSGAMVILTPQWSIDWPAISLSKSNFTLGTHTHMPTPLNTEKVRCAVLRKWGYNVRG